MTQKINELLKKRDELKLELDDIKNMLREEIAKGLIELREKAGGSKELASLIKSNQKEVEKLDSTIRNLCAAQKFNPDTGLNYLNLFTEATKKIKKTKGENK